MEQPEEEEENEEDIEDAIKESQNQHKTKDNTDSTEIADGSTAEEEDLTAMMNSTSLRSSSPSSQPPMDSGSDAEATTTTSLPVPIVGSTNAPINIALPESIMARSATPTSTAQFALAAGMLGDGPMTPMNDAGPFLFESTTGRRTRNVDDIAREPVHEEGDE